jgi:hypothetical protein
MSLRHALSPSGGAVYHIIARRRSRTTWRGFRAVVRQWLNEWRPMFRGELIIFGPSAGWTLPLQDFAHLTRLTIIEPDPIARFLLRRRLIAVGLRTTSLEFIARADLLPWFSTDAAVFNLFLKERPNAAILFSNVLGQIPLHLSPSQRSRTAQAQSDFLTALKDRKWASYHDLFSGSSIEAEPLKSSLLIEHPDAAAKRIFTSGDVIDHETAWLSEGRATELALWPITEKSTHLIGFVKNETSF